MQTSLDIQSISSLISRVNRQIEYQLESELAKIGLVELGSTHALILMHLFKEGALSMTDLAERIERKKNTVTALIKKLETLEYVKKTQDILDLRVHLIELTPQAKKLEGIFTMISNNLENEVLKGFSKGQKKQLTVLLQILDWNLS